MRLPVLAAVVSMSALRQDALALQRSMGPAMADSAGIAIVAHAATASVAQFRLQATGLEIGTAAGAELVRVIAAIRMPNGRIVVGDAGRRQLLRFGPGGALERVLGRDGSGPGEFVDMRSLTRHTRDSIVAYDGRHVRYAVFTDSGFVRQVVLQRTEHMFPIAGTLIGLHSDGSAFVTAGGSIALGDPGPARLERESFPVVRYRPDGSTATLLGHFPGFELEVAVLTSGPRAGGFYKRLRVFGTTSSFAFAANQLIVVDNAVFQFDVHDSAGRLVRRVRQAHVPEVVRPTHVSEYAIARSSAIADPARRAEARESYESTSHAPVFPALDPGIVVDSERRIWLGTFRKPGDKEQLWSIFTVAGVLAGQVRVPAALTVSDAGNDWVLGVWRDEDGVQTVRLYRLLPGG